MLKSRIFYYSYQILKPKKNPYEKKKIMKNKATNLVIYKPRGKSERVVKYRKIKNKKAGH